MDLTMLVIRWPTVALMVDMKLSLVRAMETGLRNQPAQVMFCCFAPGRSTGWMQSTIGIQKVSSVKMVFFSVCVWSVDLFNVQDDAAILILVKRKWISFGTVPINSCFMLLTPNNMAAGANHLSYFLGRFFWEQNDFHLEQLFRIVFFLHGWIIVPDNFKQSPIINWF